MLKLKRALSRKNTLPLILVLADRSNNLHRLFLIVITKGKNLYFVFKIKMLSFNFVMLDH